MPLTLMAFPVFKRVGFVLGWYFSAWFYRAGDAGFVVIINGMVCRLGRSQTQYALPYPNSTN